MPDTPKYSERELEEIVERLMTRVVDRILENIGYDVSTPESRAAIRDDHRWVRDFRTSASTARSVTYGAGLTAVVTGSLVLVWQALKMAFKETVR